MAATYRFTADNSLVIDIGDVSITLNSVNRDRIRAMLADGYGELYDHVNNGGSNFTLKNIGETKEITVAYTFCEYGCIVRCKNITTLTEGQSEDSESESESDDDV